MKKFEFESIPVRAICPECGEVCPIYSGNISFKEMYVCDHCGKESIIDSRTLAIIHAVDDLEGSM